jgi:Damage-control phosphatase ARMT1-like domain
MAETSIAPGDPVRSDRPGSFPWTVLNERHPALLRQVRAALPWSPDRLAAIDDLAREIDGVIEPLTDDGPDAGAWAGWAADHLGRSWGEVPFLWAENYFYRKLLAATGYLSPGPWHGIDPFGPAKAGELAGPVVDDELAALDRLRRPELDPLLLSALWGNQADLGFLVTGGGAARVDRLLVDDRALLGRLTGNGRVVLVADNAGRELLPDLVLIDHLLSTGRAAEVTLQVKPSPYFVSDATVADVLAALARLTGGPAAAAATGRRLAAAIRNGHLSLRAHPFSVSPFGYQEAPPDLRAEFAAAELTIMKGDLNYRRLIGDRHRPPTSSFAELTDYFPGPVLALRTLKSEVVVGLDAATAARLDATEPGWRTSGRHALIQGRG